MSAYQTATNWSEYASQIVAEGSSTTEYVIEYTSSDGNIVTPYSTSVFGANIVSNVYENGKGVIAFDGPVTTIGERVFYNCSTLVSITIPDSVTLIGNWAFDDCTSLTSVTIPNSVTSIGSYAFRSCTSLTSVTIPNSVTSIGNDAFCGCTGLTKVTIGNSVTSIGSSAFENCTSLTSVTIPNSVTSIRDSAFKNCTSLTSVTIPSSVTKIEYGAFGDCTSLTSVTIPSSVTKIENGTFKNCTSLTSVTIPESVTSIGDSAFCSCTSLTSVTIPSSVTEIRYETFRSCTSLTSVTIPNSVTSIGNYAFYQCTSLASITIPNSVTKIGNRAFYGCTSLTNIVIPDKVTSIGDWAFGYCSGLTKVTIGNSVTSIGSLAFYDCTSLTSVTIPNSVTSIGSSAFENCNSLKRVDITDLEAWCKIEFSNSYANPIDNEADLYLNGSKLTELTIPNGITAIKPYTFSRCTSITNVTIPGGVTEIGTRAFYYCNNLTSVIIGEGVTAIGDSAFHSCSKLAEVYCKPTTPPTLNGDKAFTNNASNRMIFVPSESVDKYKYAPYWNTHKSFIVADPSSGSTTTEYVIEYTSSDGNIVTPYGTPVFGANIVSNVYENGKGIITFDGPVTKIGGTTNIVNDKAFYNCRKLLSITIPNSVTSIESCAFMYCTGLTSVMIGSGVTYIGGDAFYSCTSLTSITIPNSVTSIDSGVFGGCTSLKSFYGKYASEDNRCLILNGELISFAPAGLTKYSISESATSIRSAAFDECSDLTSVTIPNSVTSIESGAFTYCTSLNSFYGKYASDDNRCLIVNGVLTSFAPAGLTTYSIPASVISIGNSTFSGYTLLTSVTIPDSVTSIGDNAFCRCSGLTNVTIPDSVTSIEFYAFYSCTSLTNVTIGNNVTSIGQSAFASCSKLAEVYCKPTTPPTLGGSSVFDSNASGRKIYVPSASVSAYQTATNWSEYASQIVAEGSSTTEYVIEYTSTDGNIVTPYSTSVFGANIVSNAYENGKGTITFDGPVTTIGERAFYKCSTLASITIPNSVTSIGNRAFYSCTSLSSVTIPNSVTSIGNYAFYGCTSLSSVTIPNSVTSIGDYTFYKCTSLDRVTIPDSVTSIGYDTFYNCSALTSVTIPESVTSIGNQAFYNCTSLTSVTIPNSVTEIGDGAFSRCASLKNFYGKFASDDNRCLIVNGVVTAFAPAGLTSYIIPNSVTSIGNNAFYYCSGLTSVTIPNSVTSIGNYAFGYCSGLTSATIPNSVTSIGSSAFRSCTSLSSVTIPNSVTSIGNYAFYGCTSLERVTIPESVTSIGNNAFYGCSKLTTVYCKPTTPPTLSGSYVFDGGPTGRKIYVPSASVNAYKAATYWSEYADQIVADPSSGSTTTEYVIEYTSTDGAIVTPNTNADFGANIVSNIYENGKGVITFDGPVTTIGAKAFYNCSTLASFTIPNSVTSIGSSAFRSCTSLTSVTIPESVTSIGDYTFHNCTSLTSVTIPNGVTSIGNYTFDNCTSLTSVTIPDSVTSIGNYTFDNCTSLTSVTIPNSVTEIGIAPFRRCTSLKSFYGKFASEDNRCLIVNGELKSFAPAGLTSYIIPNSVTSIGNNAFYNCSALTSVTIPDSVTEIGNYAFYDCTSLTSVTIPNSVTSIGDHAFYHCNKLTSVTIPNSVTSIGVDAFYNCSKLATVYCKPTTPPTLGGSSVFDGNASGRKIYVPSASVDTYKTATNWSEYADQIVADPSSASSTYYVEDAACGLSMKMIWVEGGTFTMGATAEQGSDPYDDEKPAHSVTVSSYYIAECEVTQAQWKKIMGTTINDLAASSSLKGVGDNYPIYYVTYDEAKEFCSKLSALTGKNYSLPTEAQWEYAARGGKYSKGYKYSGSSTISEVSWYGSNSGSTAHPVKQKKANELGLYDMSGNIYEWCSDWWTSSYSSGSQIDPTGAATGTLRAKRGGSWVHGQTSSRVSDRGSYSPSSRSNDGGFRVVCK